MERSSCLSSEGGTSTKTPTTETEKKKQEESLDQILSRHKHETAELQNKEMSLKKAAARGSKAEQKAKKKQVENEISQLSMKLKAKQAEELASLGYTNSNGKEKGDLNHLVMAIAGVSVSGQGDPSKPGESVKRREKRAQQEAAREQRIQEEQSNIISDRMIENEELEKKLKPLGLKVNEIKPDGHCLYRAVEDQLSLQSGSAPYSYRELREMVATYMRAHASDFLPFFLSENETESDSLLERFENYCTEVESTAAWGGQLELRALTHCLRKQWYFQAPSQMWRWERSTSLKVGAAPLIQASCCHTTGMHLDSESTTILLFLMWLAGNLTSSARDFVCAIRLMLHVRQK
eukprot:TRINITY_DN1433_c0_g1_i2.p1 TRINITY_DN1433_c0_g1~~TRINITY_DN1433_c0_g1_i2.p1  ORF type:complete len:379 (-),score=85.59 TRINITY_DN1433_c0_g1_i2:172-1218(-)